MTNKEDIKALVRECFNNDIGERSFAMSGFGLLRLYPKDKPDVALHIWHHEMVLPGVTSLHTHPWDFNSTVFAGRITNIKYVETHEDEFTNLYNKFKIYPGQLPRVEKPELVHLAFNGVNEYGPGEEYTQKANEIHRTEFKSGTITWVNKDRAEP